MYIDQDKQNYSPNNSRFYVIISILVVIIVLLGLLSVWLFKEQMNIVKSEDTNKTIEIDIDYVPFEPIGDDNEYVFRLIDDHNEFELATEDLLQAGPYYQNIGSGDIYFRVFSSPCDGQTGKSKRSLSVNKDRSITLRITDTETEPLPYNIVKLAKLEGVNSSDFKVYDSLYTDRYATDGKEVYVSWSTFEYCDIVSGVSVLSNADPLSFDPININYSKDKNSVFKVGLPDIQSYRSSPNARDIIYMENTKILDRDPETFRLYDPRARFINVISLDKESVYLDDTKLINADPDSFQIVQTWGSGGRATLFSRDKDNVFIDYCLLGGVHADDFYTEKTISGLIPLNVAYGDQMRFTHIFSQFNIEFFSRPQSPGVIYNCNLI